MLQAGPGQTTNSLARDCRVSRRTIFRDLEVLRLAGLPVEFDEDQQRYGCGGRVLLPGTSFTPDEALALLLISGELGHQEGVPFQSAARRAAAKLECSLPPRLRQYVRETAPAVRIKLEPNNQLGWHEATYQALLAAISRRQAVRITYDSLAEKQLIVTRLSPYRLLFSRRSWYVVGRSSLHRGVRTFNLGRVRMLEPLADRFQIPRGFSIERYLRNAWHLIPEPGPDRDVTIRFHPLVAQNVAEVTWHKTQRLKMLSDGSLEFRVRVSGLNEISWWVLGYGDQALVVKPPALRELIVRRAERLLKQYKLPTGPAERPRVVRPAARKSRRATVRRPPRKIVK